MGHAPLEVRDIPAINLIIGKNDAGKTSLLKLLYAVSKTFEIYNKKKVGLPEVSFRKELAEKLTKKSIPSINKKTPEASLTCGDNASGVNGHENPVDPDPHAL